MFRSTQQPSLGKRLWMLAGAQLCNALSSSAVMVGVALIGAHEQDPQGMSLVLAARALPTVLVAVLGGFAADRWSRSVLAGVCLALVGMTYVIGGLFLLPAGGLGLSFQIAMLVAGVAGAFGAPALYTLLPSVVDETNIVRGNAVVRTARNLGSVVGPPVVTVVAVNAGPEILIAMAGLPIFLASALALATRVYRPAEAQAGLVKDMGEAVAEAKGNLWLVLGIPFWAIYLTVQSGADDVIQPLQVIQAAGAPVWSIMVAVASAGYILGGVVAFKINFSKNLLALSVAFGSLAVLPLLAVSLGTPVWLWVLASFVAGFGLELSGVLWGSVLQTRVRGEVLGKVSSLDYALSFGFIPLGYTAFGYLGSQGYPNTGVLLVASLFLGVLSAVMVLVSLRIEHRGDA